MKICPFISHMIGDGAAGTLTMDASRSSESSTESSGNVVVLGYDEGQTAVKTKSKRQSKSKAKSEVNTHLYCLEDSCRFYQAKTGDCQFDLTFEMLAAQKKADATKPADNTKGLQKDLDKIWKFQTQSVAELIESLSDAERKQSEAVVTAKDELEKRIEDLEDSLCDKLDDAPSTIEKRFEELEEALTDRISDLGDGPDLGAIESKFDEIAKHVKTLRNGPDLTVIEGKLSDMAERIGSLAGGPDMSGFERKFDELTKRVRELGDRTEFEAFQRKIDNLAFRISELGDESNSDSFALKVDELSSRIADREESVENLTSTISEMVINVQEGLDQLQEKSDSMSQQVDRLQQEIPTADQVRGWVADSVSKQPAALDFTEALRNIERKVDESASQRSDSATNALKDKLEETLKVHRDIEHKLSDWHTKIQTSVGELKDQQGNWEARIAELSKKQSEMGTYLEEGRQHRETDETRQSKKEARKYNNLGVTSFHNGVYEMAKDHFLKAVRLDPEFAEAYNNLGLSYTELNQEEKATEAFERAVQISPSLHAAYNNLGYIFFKQGNYDQAVEMYNEALGRSTNNSSAYTNLGNAYYKMDKIDEARRAWQKALELDPGNEKAKRNLQRIDED